MDQKPQGTGKSLEDIAFKDIYIGMPVVVQSQGYMTAPGSGGPTLEIKVGWFKAHVIHVSMGKWPAPTPVPNGGSDVGQIVLQFDDTKALAMITHGRYDCSQVFFLEEPNPSIDKATD
jgi:hypothetical protein